MKKACLNYPDMEDFFRKEYTNVNNNVLPISPILNGMHVVHKYLKKEANSRSILPQGVKPLDFTNAILVLYFPLIEVSFIFYYHPYTDIVTITPYAYRVITFDACYDPYSIYFYKLTGERIPDCPAMHRFSFKMIDPDGVAYNDHTYSTYNKLYTDIMRHIIMDMESIYNIKYIRLNKKGELS